MKKVVLAFSGGLDTSFCAVYLSKEKNLEVHAVTVNTGGFTVVELDHMKEKAAELGIHNFTVLEETNAYYEQCVKYLIYGNVLKNNTYPLSVSAERIFQATAIAAYAKKINADYVAHGSTGAGNDQVRFDLVFIALIPNIGIITPVRDLKLSRKEEIEFLLRHGIEVNFEKSAYSINKGLWGTSVGGKETLVSNGYLPESAFTHALERDDGSFITLHFEKGQLTGMNDKSYSHPTLVIQALQQIAQAYAIGRDIHVGDTIIGIKGRVGFESAAPLIILKAHHALEKHVLSKYQLIIKDQFANWYGSWLHEGQFLDPVMRDMEAFFTSSQEKVSGKVFVQLEPYRFYITGVESPHDLMHAEFGSYGEINNAWTVEDVKGFTKIFGNAVSIYHRVNANHEN